MRPVKELKQNVKRRMRYCWGENAAIFFITAGGVSAIVLAWFMTADFLRAAGIAEASRRRIDLTDGVTLAVTAAALLILYIIAEPFRYGVKWYRLQQVRGNSVHARSLFSCYGSWKRAGQIFRLEAYLFLRKLYFTAPLALLLALGLYLVHKIQSSGIGALYGAAAVTVLLLTAGVICAASVFNCRFTAAAYLFVLNPEASPKELVEKSVRISAGKTDYLAEAALSSAKWFPACIFIFPAVFTIPYMQMVFTAAVNEIILSENDDPTEGKNAERDGKQVTVVAE
ncbi:MAG: hypothetical protein K2K34_08670 [Oscillospiraceae bacterium]|nr:hypothetical protein [Oscillospiraceae bacterium]